MSTQPKRFTHDDYLHFPPDRRWELVEGVPHVVPSPNRRHQEICVRLVTVIANHLDEHGGGSVFVAPFDAVLTDIDVVQPDIVFAAEADSHVLTDDNIMGSPTWVIEILSNPYYERDKLRRYEAAAVYEHWLVNPYEDTLEVRVHDGSSYRDPNVYGPGDAVQPRSLPQLQIDLGPILRR